MMGYTRKEIIGDCTLYLADCLDVLPKLSGIDAIVCDPPYGIDLTKNGQNKRQHTKKSAKWAKPYAKEFVGQQDWDILNPAVINLCHEISKHQIIFGGNYYELPPTSCWLIWYKDCPSTDQADAEMAWTNLKKAVRVFTWLWDGFKKKKPEPTLHPTQKPESLMRWCISHLPKDTNIICDPFMGSGTTGVACVQMGRKFIGIELDEGYFNIACQRIRDAYKQPDFFVDVPIKIEQASMIYD